MPEQPTEADHAEKQSGEPAPAGKGAWDLTPEERLALFEKEMKENDWGHQPC
jgi:hypothetical protein